MSALKLSFACVDYDRTRALQDGRVRPQGVDLNFLPLPVEETFYRQLRHQEFDVSEMSLSSYLLTLDQDEPPFVALPVFPSRYFRHQSIYINTNSGITGPEDLAGKRIGIPEYQMTASVWQRGILQDDYGVAASSMTYFTGAIEQSGRDEKLRLDLPGDIRIQAIGPDDNLSGMLEEGRIDAIFSASEPSCVKRAGHVRHLFEDYVAVEREYFARTRILPIMHTVVVRRPVLEQHPWVARELVKAFNESLSIAYDDLLYRSALKTMLPWLNRHVQETTEALGEGYWDYGLEKNRHVLEVFARYSYEQGLARKLRAPEEIVLASADDAYRL